MSKRSREKQRHFDKEEYARKKFGKKEKPRQKFTTLRNLVPEAALTDELMDFDL